MAGGRTARPQVRTQAIATIEAYHDRVRADVFPLVDRPAGRVLDFGGGIGATAAALRAWDGTTATVLFDRVAGDAAAGIDIAEQADLEDFDTIAALLEQLGPFDTILCLDILEHLRDPWRTVQLLTGALEPGGAMIISLPNANYIGLVGPLVMRGRFDYVDAGVLDRTHLRWFTRHSMIELVSLPGMRVEAVEAHVPGRLKTAINLVTFGLFERFLASQYRLRVRKTAQ
ncbi:methyltransferase domain-containing protein [Altererythrobacter arenosus]|uniref:Methyltransferase domain-containing protein n=1 Tax=Altererythrobacter arenosus TaxID=3032592 RepID=A0ABY8FTC5_9SPHN|nr:methyltransferase domain-containing protein [Altererythrobacter sp. CAU 1644]WFL78077.1 methyltransferase domain-containing protein [Altererythrobacter sp. CAU 1644]